MSTPYHPSLVGLVDLARRDGVDVRPTLVRVVTDLYVQQTIHTREEEARYVELASRLLDAVDPVTRIHVAEKLADCAHAPRAVIEKLALDRADIAAVVLARSPVVDAAMIERAMAEGDIGHATAIAARADLTPAQTARLAQKHAPVQAGAVATLVPAAPMEATLPESPAAAKAEIATAAPPLVAAEEGGTTPVAAPPPAWAPAVAAGGQAELAQALLARSDVPAIEIAPYFLDAGRDDRRRILAALAALPELPGRATIPVDAARRLEAAALSRNSEEFAREIVRALGLPLALARRIVADPSGEPLVIVARAVDAPSDALQRILLFLNSEIGRSVERVFTLADLGETTSVATARALVTLWAGGALGRPAARPPQHRPVEAPETTTIDTRTGSAGSARFQPVKRIIVGAPAKKAEGGS